MNRASQFNGASRIYGILEISFFLSQFPDETEKAKSPAAEGVNQEKVR